MASIVLLIGGAIANAPAFSGSNFLVQFFIWRRTKRHDKAVEAVQRAQIEWVEKRQERLDSINNEIIKEHKAEKRFTDLRQQCNGIS